MAARSSRLDWFIFIALGFFWGSSYLFIKIGVDHGLQPFTLITFRLLIGLALLATVVAVAREPLPREPRTYGHLVVMGVINIAIPFGLITFAEQTVDSSLAAVINGAVPLFVIVIAALFLKGETVTINRVAGLVVGFVGVAILVGFDVTDLGSANAIGELALIGATISYAIGNVYAKAHVHGLRPMIPALFQVFFGLLVTGALAFVFEHPLAVAWAGGAVLGRVARPARLRPRVSRLLPDPPALGRDADVDGRVPAAGVGIALGRPRPPRADLGGDDLRDDLVIGGIAL